MKKKRQALYFYLFISPWIIGFAIFDLYPILSSLYYSFLNYNITNAPAFVGLKNYAAAFGSGQDGFIFRKSILVTTYYTIASVPAGLALSLIFALLLNRKMPGRNAFRTMMYLPGMISGVSMSLLWLWIFQPQYGILNYLLTLVNIQGPPWLSSEQWAVPAIIIMSFWTTGEGMVLFLAALQGVPRELEEACVLDGANGFQRFRNITVPMISPIILFQLIINIINSFQLFTQAYVMTQSGGPHYATTFYVYNIYVNAFKSFRLGYASALSWMLLIFIMFLTFIIMRTSDRFVYYEGGENS